jgi:hypothetical protein
VAGAGAGAEPGTRAVAVGGEGAGRRADGGAGRAGRRGRPRGEAGGGPRRGSRSGGAGPALARRQHGHVGRVGAQRRRLRRAGQRHGIGPGQLLGGGDQLAAEPGGVDAGGRVERAGRLDGGDERAQLLGHVDGVVEAGHERADGRVGREGHLPGHGLDQHEGQRVDVAAPVDRLPPGLLGRGVAGGAEHRALRLGPRRLGDGPRQAEVGDAQPGVGPEEQVRRLDVAVDEALAVGVLERPGGLQPDDERLAGRQPVAGVEDRAEAAAAQVLGDEEGRALVAAPVVDGDDVGMAQGGRGLGLGPEAAQEGLVVGEAGMEDLHRHPAAQPDVVGQVDLRRGASAQRREQPVAPTQHTTDLIGHAG